MQYGIVLVNGEHRGLKAERCTSFTERARGLLGRPMLAEDEGLWIAPCASVHTFGMNYAIDVIFCDYDGLVVRVVENLQPGSIVIASGARSAYSLRSGMTRAIRVRTSDRLVFQLAPDTAA